jgi:3-hydroxyacyl-[acyl-carrier-protein] dehydratase
MHVEVLRHRGDMFKFRGKAMLDDRLTAQVDFAAMVVNTPTAVP